MKVSTNETQEALTEGFFLEILNVSVTLKDSQKSTGGWEQQEDKLWAFSEYKTEAGGHLSRDQ